MKSLSRIVLLVCIAVLSLLISAGTAGAALKAVGPTSLVTTLPAWFQDTNNVRLEPCLDQNGFCILTPLFDPAITNPPNTITTTGPINDTNFPDESFYFIVDSTMDVYDSTTPGAPGKAVLRMALEAAFLTGVAPNTGQYFLRVNLKQMKGLAPNSTFTVTYPYGTFQFTTDAIGTASAVGGAAFRAEDFPPLFLEATNTHIGPFLTDAAGLVVDPGTGNIYIGNPAVAVPVTGSPTGNNFFRIDGPDIGGPGINTAETTLFNVSGKVFTGTVSTPLTVDRATYARDASTTEIDVFATTGTVSNLGTPSVLQVSGAGIPTTTMATDNVGASFAHIVIPNPVPFPGNVTVTNISDNAAVPTPTLIIAPLVDEVGISQATFNTFDNTLRIRAASRDTLVPPTLTAVGFTPALDAAGSLVVPNLPVVPASVTIVSPIGGGETEWVGVDLPATGVTLSPSIAGPQPPGTSVTFTAAASGGSGPPYEYQFSDNATGTLTVTQPYSTTAARIWDTTGVPDGSYAIKVDARRAGSTSTSEASAVLGYAIGSSAPVPATGASLFVTPASSQPQGTPVTFIAVGSGGSLVYEYEFSYRLSGTLTYTLGQAYSASSTWAWNTTAIPAGNYDILVNVRSAGSTAASEASATTTFLFTGTGPAATVVLNPSPASPQAPGATVTWTAVASGGSGTYQYEFWLYDGTSWSLAKPYGATNDNTWAWNTTGLVTGTYRVQVWARSVGSTADYEAFSPVVIYVLEAPSVAPATSVTLTPPASPASPQAPGTSVTWSAVASGGSGSYEYQFWLYNGTSWSIAKPYGAANDNTWIWDTTGFAAGTYRVQVWARNAGSTANYEAFTLLETYVLQ